MKEYKHIKVQIVDYGFGFKMEGDMSTLTVDNILTALDYKFEKLEEEIEARKIGYSELDNINIELNYKIQKLKECVEFYAVRNNWESIATNFRNVLISDNGIKARQTLKELDK